MFPWSLQAPLHHYQRCLPPSSALLARPEAALPGNGANSHNHPHAAPSLQFGIPQTQLCASRFNCKPQSLSVAGPRLHRPSPARLGTVPTASSSEQGCVAAFPEHILNLLLREPALEREQESRVKPQFARPGCLRRAIWLGSRSKLNLLDGFEGQ